MRTYYWNQTNILKFIELFKSEHSIVVKNVATYVQKSMEKRNNDFVHSKLIIKKPISF